MQPMRSPWQARAGADGEPAVPHGSRVKVRLQHPGGFSVDRIPAWVRWATVEAKMGARYDGVHWAPPPGERHAWCAWLRTGQSHTLAQPLDHDQVTCVPG